MLTLQEVIDDVGGQAALRKALQAIVDKMPEPRTGGLLISARLSKSLVHSWVRSGGVSKAWLPIIAVLCLSRGLNLDAQSVIGLAGGRTTLADALDAMGIQWPRQENLVKTKLPGAGAVPGSNAIPAGRGRARS